MKDKQTIPLPAVRDGGNQSDIEHAIASATPANAALRQSFMITRRRTLTRRGVIWLGQTCNLHCQFCYFIDKIHSRRHPEHEFMSLEKAKKICKTLVDVYGNNAIDIQGGEPTIYNDIYDLVTHCNGIGLRPTLITNALVLDNKETCRKHRDAGIRDFLISVHGLGEVYDRLVGQSGAHRRQMKALSNLQEVGIPFRLNCVLSKPVLEQLPGIARLAIRTGAFVVNFIAFNPFEDQSRKGRRSTMNVPRYSEVKAPLTEALDRLEAADVEANVRYFPICMLEGRHRKSTYNFQQLPYDHHEWDYASWGWTGLQPQRMKDGEPTDPVPLSSSKAVLLLKKPFKRLANITCLRSFLYKAHHLAVQAAGGLKTKEDRYRAVARIHAETHCGYAYGETCMSCMAKDICDGFHGDYAHIFGTREACAIEGDIWMSDPLHYIRHQEKVVEKEDEGWALP